MPSPVRFSVVRKMLEANGWTFTRCKGSHHQFTKPGHRTMVVTVHGGKVAPVYVSQIEKIIAKEADEEA
jgi:predicted RNA binding protein YcfA (HicA-like mRNA interferase family)